ncbi:hypothetical protein SAMN02910275_00153 [Butyrivibrio sp. INlla18]|uniref:hypothetical protein n=1 Tax=Butyrivibrio sp. INlla18 TaxID=1520806 RepID=UPI000884E4C1|nr:hypothetical protein [Butyrivibrio sp. INlla18]SDA39001.1 hypothetical protein SAMN02910275_00153 [Butyrivibrio sp. INlla18]
MENTISSITKYLMDCDFFSDEFDPDGNEEHLETAEKLLHDYPWKDIYAEWRRYLHEECKTPEAVINFANLFMYYDGADNFIPDPLAFIGYLYSMVDMDKYWDKAGETFDSLSCEIMTKAGLADLTEDPFYRAKDDPRVIDEIKKFKSQICNQ